MCRKSSRSVLCVQTYFLYFQNRFVYKIVLLKWKYAFQSSPYPLTWYNTVRDLSPSLEYHRVSYLDRSKGMTPRPPPPHPHLPSLLLLLPPPFAFAFVTKSTTSIETRFIFVWPWEPADTRQHHRLPCMWGGRGGGGGRGQKTRSGFFNNVFSFFSKHEIRILVKTLLLIKKWGWGVGTMWHR